MRLLYYSWSSVFLRGFVCKDFCTLSWKLKHNYTYLKKILLNMRILNKIPILSFYYRSQVRIFLIFKNESCFFLKFLFLSVLFKVRMETCFHLYIFGLLFGLPVVESWTKLLCIMYFKRQMLSNHLIKRPIIIRCVHHSLLMKKMPFM